MGSKKRAAGFVRLRIDFEQSPVDLVLVVIKGLIGPSRITKVVAEPRRNLVADYPSEACNVRRRHACIEEPPNERT